MLSAQKADVLVSVVERRGIDLAIFDFGGTIYNFTPVHIDCFLSALEGYISSSGRNTVAQITSHSIRVGEDSFSIARRLIQEFSLTLDARELAINKRLLVESYIVSTALEEAPKRAIGQLLTGGKRVAIITRGMKQSVLRIIENSWPEVGMADRMEVFGRSTIGEVVYKTELLKSAIATYSGGKDHSIFIGDSEEDKRISRICRIGYFDCS